MEIVVDENLDIHIHDKIRNAKWQLDNNAMFLETAEGQKEKLAIVDAKAFENQLTLAYKSEKTNTQVAYTLSLCPGYIEAALATQASLENFAAITMPSLTTTIKKYIMPILQGMLWDTRGEPFEETYHEAAHSGFSMPMFALLSEKGGALYIAETQDDCTWSAGKDIKGRTWCCNVQHPSLGTLGYNRVGRIYFTQPSITKAAKVYRAYVKEKGRFISFKEKIETRPSLANIFGAVMCFIGYCQDDIDYVENFKKLKAYGFDKALVYPARFNTYSQGFNMGGAPPINLSDDEIAAIKALGYDIAPWSWVNEGLDDETANIKKMARRNKTGELTLGWQIDDYKYYHVCSTFMEEFYRKRTRMKEMTWDHFDVITCATNNECYALDHEAHLGKPLNKTQDREYLRKLLLAAGEYGPVSSENFNDAYSLEYDIGSVKALVQNSGFMYMPIPLTMLVYHDSIVHSWWEVHNYNCRYFRRDRSPFYQYGGGGYELMAAMDALYGCPPDIHPFGAQYAWTGEGQKTWLYRFRFEDPETQLALKLALPVAKSHEKIGMMEMVDFEFISDDYNLQRTVFEDGTTIYANFGLHPQFHSECGSLASCEWRQGRCDS